MNNEIQTTTAISEPMQLIVQAMDKGLSIETMEKLFAMQERWEAKQAERSFEEDFRQFQFECPDIRKTKGVKYKESQDKDTYRYAPLPDIIRQIKGLEHKFGFTHRWEFNTGKEDLEATCIVTHRSGHKIRATMSSGADKSGGKQDIQARGSGVEYLKRYTLVAAYGICTSDQDNDGRTYEYETDVDKLHQTFMDEYVKVIDINPTLDKWHPDNWLVERTGKNYIKAIGDIRKILFDLQKKKQ